MGTAIARASEIAVRSRARLGVLALIATGTGVNYLDRAVLGIAAPFLANELGLSASVMGVVFSAFSWTYAAAQIPGGVALDRFGTRVVYGVSVALWSLLTLLQGLGSSFAALLGCRLGLGIAEAPCFPANSRVLGSWFPQHERARANGIFSLGQYLGLAFLSPLLFWIVDVWGWRMLFVLSGSIGLLFSMVWWRLYREPRESHANQAELEYIEAGGGFGTSVTTTPFSWRNLARLMRTRAIVGASIGQFASNSTLVFFLTWFPTYLASERHMEWLKAGGYATFPYIAAAAGVLSGGWLSDWLICHSGSATIGRKVPVIGGLLMASTIVSANYLQNNTAVTAVMSIAFFGQGMCNLGWTLITDVAPRKVVGLTGGLFNLCANLAGIVTPIVIGVVISRTGSFAGALVFVALLALVGAFSYLFIIGEVRRADIDDPDAALPRNH